MTQPLSLLERAELARDRAPAAVIARFIIKDSPGPARYRANLLITELLEAGFEIVSKDGRWPPPLPAQEETP